MDVLIGILFIVLALATTIAPAIYAIVAMQRQAWQTKQDLIREHPDWFYPDGRARPVKPRP